MKRRIPTWVRAGIALAVLISVFATGTWYLFGRIYATEEQTCLASIINSKLDKLAIWKGEGNAPIAEQQAEIIGRVEDRTARERKRTHCAEAISRRLAQSRWNYFTGPKNQSPRWHLVYDAAGRVLAQQFRYPLPGHCKDVKAYRPTRMRGLRTAWENRDSPGFDVGNMRAYCD